MNVFLRGEKIDLLPLTPEHAAACALWGNDPEITRHMVMGTFPHTLRGCQRELLEAAESSPGPMQHAALPTAIPFAISHKEAGHIGNVGLFDIDWVSRRAEVRILIGNRGYQRQGCGAEAYRLVMEYAFDGLGLHKLEAGYHEGNVASRALHERFGFRQEGVRRSHVYKAGSWCDLHEVGILREEFEERKDVTHGR